MLSNMSNCKVMHTGKHKSHTIANQQLHGIVNQVKDLSELKVSQNQQLMKRGCVRSP